MECLRLIIFISSSAILIIPNPKDISLFHKMNHRFGLKSAEVVFPRTTKMVLIDIFCELQNEVKYVKKLILGFTKQQLYSATNTFFFTGQHGLIQDSKELVS